MTANGSKNSVKAKFPDATAVCCFKETDGFDGWQIRRIDGTILGETRSADSLKAWRNAFWVSVQGRTEE